MNTKLLIYGEASIRVGLVSREPKPVILRLGTEIKGIRSDSGEG